MVQNSLFESEESENKVGRNGSIFLGAILVLYFLASGFTFALGGEVDTGSLSGRAAIPEIVLILFLLVSLIVVKGLTVPTLGLVSLAMLGYFCFSTVIAAFTTGLEALPNVIFFEILVHGFNIVGFIGIYRYISSLTIEQRVTMLVWWARTAGILAFIGVWDFFSSFLGLPSFSGTILPARTSGPEEGALASAVVGTFRNTGQAGAFYHMTLTCAIATTAVLKETPRRRTECILWSILLGVAIVLTVKRVAILGVAIGLVALLIRARGFKALRLLFVYLVLGGGLFLAIPQLLQMEGGFAWHLGNKFSDSGVETTSSFLSENIEAVRESLLTNPLTGLGVLGTLVAGKWEIHSTYLKILGDYGVLGVLAYIIFIISLYKSCLVPHNASRSAKNFASFFAPLFLGLLVSWGYTYHLRKREFWISTALVSGLMAPAALVANRADDQ